MTEESKTEATEDLRQETAEGAPEVAEHDRVAELEAQLAEAREDEKLKGLVTGLEATGRELDSVFARHGISKVSALGEALDPNRHQAMMEVPSADAAPGTIVQEIQTGYMIKDRLLRPALVGVARKPD